MTKNARFRIALSLVVLLCLPGCGAFGERPAPVTAPPATTAPAETTTPTPAPVQKTVIVYARGMDETESTALLLEAFNAKSETVTVKYQELASDSTQRHNQLVTSFAAQNAEIDVFDADATWPAEFAARGFTMNVDAYASRDELTLTNYWPGMISTLTYQSLLWGLPKTASAGVLYYRTDLVPEPPGTWEALTAMAAEVPLGVSGFVTNGATNDTLVGIALEMIFAYGGQVLDQTGRVVIDSENAIAGLEQMRTLYSVSIAPPDILSMTDNDACVSFLQGESAMMRNWPYAWAIGKHADNAVTGLYAIAPLPSGDAGNGAVLSGVVMMMNAQTKHPDEAWAFMRYVAGEEGQTLLAIEGGRIPALRWVMQKADVVEANPHFGDTNFRRALEGAAPRAVTPYYAAISTVMQEELATFLRFEQTAEEVAKAIDRRINAVLRGQTDGAE